MNLNCFVWFLFQKQSSFVAQSTPKRRLSQSVSEAFSESEAPKQKKKKKTHEEAGNLAPNNGPTTAEPRNRLKKLLSDKQSRFYLLKLPKDVDAKDLIGKTIPINKSAKIRLKNKGKLQTTPEENSSSTCQIFAPGLFHLGRIEGVINSKLKVKSHHEEILEPLEKNFAVDVNIKQRHPIFGSSFSEELAVDKAVGERLENPVKIKKKKHKKEEIDEEEEEEEEVEVVKKKKKKKDKEHQDEDGNLEFLTVDEPQWRKKKKHHEKEEAVVVNDAGEEEPKKKKKKKKDKEEHQEEEEENLVFSAVNNELQEKQKKKKKDREQHQKEDENLELYAINSESQDKEKKKKKKKEKTEEEEPVKQKKKQKKHQEERHKKQQKEEEESDIDLDVFSILTEAKQKILGKT